MKKQFNPGELVLVERLVIRSSERIPGMVVGYKQLDGSKYYKSNIIYDVLCCTGGRPKLEHYHESCVISIEEHQNG